MRGCCDCTCIGDYPDTSQLRRAKVGDEEGTIHDQLLIHIRLLVAIPVKVGVAGIASDSWKRKVSFISDSLTLQNITIWVSARRKNKDRIDRNQEHNQQGRLIRHYAVKWKVPGGTTE